MEIASAESLTRFLRSKDASVAEVLSVATSFLQHRLDVNLPNGQWFIFELICDRLNDTGKFKTWKAAPEVWKLICVVWPQLADHSRRNKIFRRVKLADVLSSALHSKDQNLLNEVYNTLQMVQTTFDIDLDDYTSTSLLQAYTHILESDCDAGLLLKWTLLVSELYNDSHADLDYVPTKKATERFYKDCVPAIANKIVMFDSTSRIYEILTLIIEETAFAKLVSSSIAPNLDALIKLQALSSSALEYLFGLIVQAFGTKEVKICEEVFLAAVKSQNYMNITEALMGVLAGLKKPLSAPFLAKVYEETVASDLTNWTLMGHLVDLDVSLALDKTNEIIEKLQGAPKSQMVSISTKLLNAFAKSRDLVEFFTTIWYNANNSNPLWKSLELIDNASSIINELTATQIIEIMTELSQKSASKYPIILSVLKGLLNAPQKTVDSVKESMHPLQSTDDSECPWELRYLLAILYEDQSVSKHSPPNTFDKFYLFYQFRITEVTGTNTVTDELKSLLLKQITKTSGKDLVVHLLERWPVLINTFFSDEEMNILITSILNSHNLPLIHKILVEYPEVLLEQTRVVSKLLDSICSQLDEETTPLLPLIPMECYTRLQRVSLLDGLMKTPFTRNSANAIKHLVSVASFKALIETDFNTLVSLLEADAHLIDTNKETFRIVWTNHTRQLESQAFVKSAFATVIKKISKLSVSSEIPNSKFVRAGFLMMEVESRSNLSSKKKLRDCFFEFASKLLQCLLDTKVPDPGATKWALDVLRDGVTSDADIVPKVKALVTDMGSQLSAQSDEIKAQVFNLLTITADLDFVSATHIIALYMVLFQKHRCSELTVALEKFFVRLYDNYKVYNKIAEYVIYSFDKDINNCNADIFIRLLNGMLKSLSKEDPKATEKVVFSASLLLSHFDTITESDLEPLQLFLDVIKTALHTKTWVFNQYCLEQILSLISRLGQLLDTHQNSLNESIYVLSTQVIAHVLLYHRHRLSSRHHVVIGTFVPLMKALCLKRTIPNHLESSVNASSAYARLLVNLCEPFNASKLVANQLTTASSLIRKSMKQYLPILLNDYIVYSLRFNFSKVNNDKLRSGIYSIFDILSKDELESVNNLLDGPGKSIFKTVYSDYQKHGKWKDN